MRGLRTLFGAMRSPGLQTRLSSSHIVNIVALWAHELSLGLNQLHVLLLSLTQGTHLVLLLPQIIHWSHVAHLSHRMLPIL